MDDIIQNISEINQVNTKRGQSLREANTLLRGMLFEAHTKDEVDHVPTVCELINQCDNLKSDIPDDLEVENSSPSSGGDATSKPFAGIDMTCSSFFQVRALQHFRKSGESRGRLLSLAAIRMEIPRFSDHAYLFGVAQLTSCVQSVAMQNAIDGNYRGLVHCLWFVRQVFENFLQKFDFPNGFLRRSYDGVKYRLKELEQLHLDFTIRIQKPNPSLVDEVEEIQVFEAEDLTLLLDRVQRYDSLREDVVKESRFVSTKSKEAVYSLLRGEVNQAETLLGAASDKIASITEKQISEFPQLHAEGMSQAVEEYVEARILQKWMVSGGELLGPEEIVPKVKPMEYFGGLADFTGEICRLAIDAACKGRSVMRLKDELVLAPEAIEMSLKACTQVESTIYGLPFPEWFHKAKGRTVSFTCRKLEKVQFELRWK